MQVKSQENHPNYNITLIGTEGTGKTCFLAGLALLGLNPANSSPIQIYPPDEVTKQYLNDLMNTLLNGSWLPPTGITTPLNFTFHLKRSREKMRLLTLDYPGEDFRKAFNDLTPEAMQELSDHLSKSDVVLLVLDATDLVNLDDDMHKKALNKKLQAQLAAVWEKVGSATDVGVLITKSDMIPELHEAVKEEDHGARAAGEFVKKHFVDFHDVLHNAAKIERIKSWKVDNRKIVYYPISAVGMTLPETGQPDKDNLKPYGYEAVFEWVAKRRMRHQWRKILTAAFFAIMIVILIVFLFSGQTLTRWSREARYQSLMNNPNYSVIEKLDRANKFVGKETTRMRELRENLVDSELVRQRERIESYPNDETLEEIRNELSELEKLGVGGWTDELQRTKDMTDNALKEFNYQRVKNLSDAKSPELETYSARFIERYPNTPETENVKEMLAKAGLNKMQTAKSVIAEIPVNNKSQLENKLRNIGEFLREFETKLTPAEKKEIQEAANLAKKFLEDSEYKVILKQYGGFAYSDYLKLNLTINGTDHIELHKSDGKVMEVNPKREFGEFNFRWKSGEEIMLELQAPDGMFTYGEYVTAASSKYSGPDAIVLLNGRRRLNPATPHGGSYWDWSLPKRMGPNGYFVVCEIQGITPEQWKAFENYIKPGNKWREDQ